LLGLQILLLFFDGLPLYQWRYLRNDRLGLNHFILLTTRGARRGALYIRHTHHLIGHSIRFLFVCVIWPTDAKFGLEYAGLDQSLYGLIADCALKVQNVVNRRVLRFRRMRFVFPKKCARTPGL
jgi:hypothetical protein